MKQGSGASILVALISIAGVNLQADWAPGDLYKMHYPQLPDPTGWDVKIDEANIVADDFLCTESGPITQVHFWGSWQGDQVGILNNIHLSIHADIPDPDGDGPLYSQPGGLLWEYNTDQHDPALVRISGPELGDQGWFDPLTGTFAPSDHTQYFQYNITIDPGFEFIQTADTIYWLDVHVIDGGEETEFGWKTTPLAQGFNDDAVIDDLGGGYIELRDPLEPENSIDMAFVIVPEPASFALWLGMAAFVLLLIRHRRLNRG